MAQNLWEYNQARKVAELAANERWKLDAIREVCKSSLSNPKKITEILRILDL